MRIVLGGGKGRRTKVNVQGQCIFLDCMQIFLESVRDKEKEKLAESGRATTTTALQTKVMKKEQREK